MEHRSLSYSQDVIQTAGKVSLKKLAMPLKLKPAQLIDPSSVLRTHRSRPTKLRCSDLWSHRMQREAASLLLTQSPPQCHKHVKSESVDSSASLFDSFLSRAVKKHVRKGGERITLERHLSNCLELQREIKEMRYAFHNSQKPSKSLTRNQGDLSRYLKEEVTCFKRDKPIYIRKPTKAKMEKRSREAGLSFYATQRLLPI